MSQPVQIQLDGSGPFVAPTAIGSHGLAISGGQLPAQIRLVLEGGSILHLPIEEFALQKLYSQLAAYYDEPKNRE